MNVYADEGWDDYHSGVFNGCNEDKIIINHGVALVGYGDDEDGAYWIIRNHWGTQWGENGYMRLRRGPFECKVDDRREDGTGCFADNISE